MGAGELIRQDGLVAALILCREHGFGGSLSKAATVWVAGATPTMMLVTRRHQ
ncbi:MAG: hypothetical protein ACLR7Z_14515 [Bilophila wadsworthia]